MEEHKLIITNLNDYKMIDQFPLPFESRNINLHPNKKQVYLVSMSKDENLKGRWICIDLGFELRYNDKFRIDYRNQYLKAIYEGRLEDWSDILKPDHMMGAFDVLNSINLFHMSAINPDFAAFKELKFMNI